MYHLLSDSESYARWRNNQPYRTLFSSIYQAPFNIVSWVVMAITYSNGYIESRFFCGFLSVSYMVSGECLLVDTVHQKNLQHMFVMYQSSVLLGVVLTWIMGQMLKRWVTTTICAVFCAIHAIFLMFLPESPVYLYENSPIKAENALAWYRGRKDIYTEMQAIKQYSEMRKIEPTSNSTMLYSKVVIKGLLIAMGIKFFSVSSGYYVFLFYNVNILYELSGIVDTFHDTIIYGLLMYVSTFVSRMIHFNGRYSLRKPLIISSVLVTLILTVFTIYLGLATTTLNLDNDAKQLIPTFCVCILIPAYETGLSCYAEMALMDYMPYEVYPKARNLLKIWQWFLVFVLVKNVITVRDYVPVSYACILLLAILSFFGIFFMVIFVVETKGKSLVEVQRDIGGNPIGSRGRLRHHVRVATTPAPLN